MLKLEHALMSGFDISNLLLCKGMLKIIYWKLKQFQSITSNYKTDRNAEMLELSTTIL